MIGTTIHGYTISKHLGTGGMAEVWYAENKLGKPASIKIMLKQFIGIDQVVLRFENEAKTMVQLQHPNIRQVYDYGEFEQRPFIIMEYLEGQDLSSFIKKKEVPSDAELERWWQQCSSALNFTHSQGVIHRDIKPSNLFLDKNGDIKILDFGIAKVKQEITLTATGQGLGTLLYMSPQQILDPKRVTPQCDYHSLAVSFIHLITGESPYAKTESEFQLQSAIVNGEINLDGLPAKWKERLEGLVQGKNEKELNKGEGLAISQSHSPTQVYYDETHIEEKPTSKAIENNVEQPTKKKSILLFALLGILMLMGILILVFNSNSAFITGGHSEEASTPQWKIDYDEQFSLLLISESSRSAQQNKEAFMRLRNQLPEGDVAIDERKKVQDMIDMYERKIEEDARLKEAERITNLMESGKLDLQDTSPETGTFTDSRDGKTYKWVKIGKQTWMAENLNTEKFRNGDVIFNARTPEEWENANKNQQPCWCYYDNSSIYGATYGKLYNWYAVIDVRGLAPIGWHIPSDAEWKNLTQFLGGEKIAGKKMKNSTGWGENRNASNVSGFSALPGGRRRPDSPFHSIGEEGHWWSSTEHDQYTAKFTSLHSKYNNFNVGTIWSKSYGFSVRCIKN